MKEAIEGLRKIIYLKPNNIDNPPNSHMSNALIPKAFKMMKIIRKNKHAITIPSNNLFTYFFNECSKFHYSY